MAKGVATLEELVLARHKLPMWAAFTELRSGTGYGRDGERSVEQRFDVVAFNCWPGKKGSRLAHLAARAARAIEAGDRHRDARALDLIEEIAEWSAAIAANDEAGVG